MPPRAAAPQVPSVNGSPGKQRAESLFSQWDLDDLSDDEDDAGFFTPTEGLSDIGEGDEDDEPKTAAGGSKQIISGSAVSASPTDATAPPAYPAAGVKSTAIDNAPAPEKAEINPDLDATNVAKGSVASSGDVLGTGPSTVHHSKPVQSTTRVKPRATTKVGALSFDQEKALGPDVDTTREVLRRFLTSQMKEAEDLCYEADPDGNHLYLQSAHGYIQALKVSLPTHPTSRIDINRGSSERSADVRPLRGPVLSKWAAGRLDYRTWTPPALSYTQRPIASHLFMSNLLRPGPVHTTMGRPTEVT